MQVKVSKQGQLTIPLPIRQQLGIVPGTWLEIEAQHGVLQASVVSHETAKPSLPSGRGLARYSGRRLSIEEMDPVRALESSEDET